MPKQPAIPLEIKAEVQKLVDEFNRKYFKRSAPLLRMIPGNNVSIGYTARFRGKFLYLDRVEQGMPSHICRLTWTGAMDTWEFAIYKYSSERYDPNEWFFPGAEELDGTVTGAMEAGMTAYPI
ncbi:MAG: hypothetical protein K8R77_04500 [Anaerolineaceae bacterium]|nr:hypothetical protein [Anaerolineaceae bacterium]